MTTFQYNQALSRLRDLEEGIERYAQQIRSLNGTVKQLDNQLQKQMPITRINNRKALLALIEKDPNGDFAEEQARDEITNALQTSIDKLEATIADYTRRKDSCIREIDICATELASKKRLYYRLKKEKARSFTKDELEQHLRRSSKHYRHDSLIIDNEYNRLFWVLHGITATVSFDSSNMDDIDLRIPDSVVTLYFERDVSSGQFMQIKPADHGDPAVCNYYTSESVDVHPHVMNGNPCLGDFTGTFCDAIQEGHIDVANAVIVQFLETIVPTDPAGRTFVNHPDTPESYRNLPEQTDEYEDEDEDPGFFRVEDEDED